MEWHVAMINDFLLWKPKHYMYAIYSTVETHSKFHWVNFFCIIDNFQIPLRVHDELN